MNLPFNKWSLNFQHQEQEDLYQEYINQYRLNNFKIFTLLVCVLCLLFLMVFLIENQSTMIVIMISAVVGSLFLLYMLSQKLTPYLNYINFFLLLWHIATSLAISKSGMQIPQYMYGFSTSTLALPMLLYSHFKLKMFAILFIPAVQLGVLDIYSIENLEFIFLAFFAQILLAIQAHNNEYMKRLAFSLEQINIKYKEIINQYVGTPFFAISLSESRQLFDLEFANNEAQRQYLISDSNFLKQFMRFNVFIEKQFKTEIDQQTLGCKNTERILIKPFIKTQQTLEDFVFKFIKQRNNIEISIEGIYINKNQSTPLNIEIKKTFFGKPILLIVIKQKNTPKIIEKYEQQILYYKTIIHQIIKQTAESHESLYQIIRFYKNQDILDKIQCINIQALNNIKNIIVLINSDKIKISKFEYQIINFNQYTQKLSYFLAKLAKQNNKKFEFLNFIEERIQISTQQHYLTQIILNLFEQALKYSKKNSLIKLQVSQLMFSDEKKRIQYKQQQEQQQSSSLEHKYLIKFEISFATNKQINLIPLKQQILDPKLPQDFLHNNSIEFEISYPICTLLLSLLGPYNEIFKIQDLIERSANDILFCNTISFFIYSDQSQINQSYLNFIKYVQQCY
ncbi:unnamed protein product [Paramecium sonneborni]|uniref:Transmembrane protein n=1 Tax=Paramecium sonneborni TaxID=65129 RepID=A0A8S1PDR9_9CILI|nr:unnamed protein product [Paramecium sonneborni]